MLGFVILFILCCSFVTCIQKDKGAGHKMFSEVEVLFQQKNKDGQLTSPNNLLVKCISKFKSEYSSLKQSKRILNQKNKSPLNLAKPVPFLV